MSVEPVVLKVLLQNRHLQTHRAFCREYDRVAAKADPTLRGGWPSKAQFYRWLSGELVGLPYPDHCRVLESMFPGWKVDQLFQLHDGGIDFIPEPTGPQKAASTVHPPSSADQNSTGITAVLRSIEQGLESPAVGQAGWGSHLPSKSRTISSPKTTFPLTVGLPGPEVEEAPAQRIARSLAAVSKRLRLPETEVAQLAKLAGHVVELDLTCSIDIDNAGWSTVTCSHQLLNLTNRPIKRLMTELWFEGD
ncbi:MAG: hypothetical protein ACRDSH_03525 [Pseudonocardiaceae bacterium]